MMNERSQWNIGKLVKMMKLISLLLMMSMVQVNARTFAQTITYARNNVSLSQLFNEIRKQTGLNVLWSAKKVQNKKTIKVNFMKTPVAQVLKESLAGQGLTYEIEDNTIIIKENPMKTSVQNVVILNDIDVHGTIKGDNNKPLVGATVTIKGTSKSAITNESGNFLLTNVDEDEVLIVSYVGYLSKEIKVSKNMGVIVLARTHTDIGETVVFSTGYQRIPKERATGSFDLISGKQIQNKIQTNVLERLEGMAPGLLLIGGKDRPNADPTQDDGLTIRGVSTLYGTKRPLIVVDNFPIEGDINSINPNDVESITILKDAAAASIWGARAANGVIVISTKQGKKGNITFQYNNSFQFQAKPNIGYLNRLSAADDIAVERKLLTPRYETLLGYSNSAFSAFAHLYMDSVAGRITPEEYAQRVSYLSGLDNTDQIKDLMMQSPFTQNHSFSFNGGNDRNQYYGSLNYTNANGYDLKQQDKTYTVFLKTAHQVTQRLSFGVNANMNFNNGTDAPVSALSIFKLKPYAMLQDELGNPMVVNRNADPANQNSSNVFSIAQRMAWGLADESYYPLKELNNKDIRFDGAAQRIQAELNYKIAEGINLGVSYQFEKGNLKKRVHTLSQQADLLKQINDFITPSLDDNGQFATNLDGTLLTPQYNIPQGAKLDEVNSNYSGHVIRGILSIDKTLHTDHAIAAQLGVENKKSVNSATAVTKYGYDDLTLKFINLDWQRLQNLPVTLLSIRYPFDGMNDFFSYEENRFVSAFGNASYTFKNKYIASGSIRIDQTNLFGTDPKYLYKPMWSAGVAWNASKETFFEGLSFVNDLQLRATYGINGNIPKNSGPFMIAAADVNFITGQPSNWIISPANNALRWERTATSNIGVDFGLFGYRIIGKLDYYKRNTTDILGDESLNPTYGFSNAQINSASMTNKGFEAQLTTKNIDGQNFRWSTTFMYAHNKNKITHSALSPAFNNPRAIANGSPFLVGMPYGGLYSIRFAGLSEDKGQLQVLDADGNLENSEEGLTSRLDFAYFSGSTRPIHNGAFTNMFGYRNFDLSCMFVFYAGSVARQNMPRGVRGPNALDGRLADAWKKPGDEHITSIPNVIDDPNSWYTNTYYRNYLDVNVFNSSYAKLREVILTYNVPANSLNRIKYLKGLQFNAQIRNLWTIDFNKFDIDPEAFANQQRTLPEMPTYSIGINATF
ncbi:MULTISPECIES: SusC/RagA family TonB-linked outer membrane protein [Sphingobacterium]|uniref:SusC/RagA family TonB-linked outer membrane protein n=1 Tax=Sphingobacterium TaxID=28453 RepID=UPI0013D92CD0|nr:MULTISPECIES: SusC/RagA family TonB-linked outer membrane protein [unclassified Sphingobacterium]